MPLVDWFDWGEELEDNEFNNDFGESDVTTSGIPGVENLTYPVEPLTAKELQDMANDLDEFYRGIL